MKKQKIGWILALSMIFTQNVSVWAKGDTSASISEKLIYAEKFASNDKISFEADVIDENTEEAEMVNNSANKTLLLEKTNPAVPVKKSDAELKTIHLNDDYSTRQKIDLTAKDTFLKIDKEIPAGKILIVSFVPDNNQYASAVIDVMNLYTHNYEYVGIPQGGWYDNSRMSYFKIRNTDMYNIEIKRIVENPISGTLRIYVADYITEQEEFEHFDSLEQKKETPDSYVVFNAPEHLHSENQLGDNYRYTGKIPVSGNANIYWEHFNEYKKDMRYGVLLHNPANRTVTVTINKKSAYYQGMNTAEQVLLNIWNDYSQNKITADETGITEFNKVLTIAPNSSAWIYLDTIESMNQANTLFNGIINLSVAQDATLYSYAFIMNIGQEVIDRIQQDFNVCGTSGIFNDWYIWAEREYEYLIGSADAPVLISKSIDLSQRSDYRLLLTGYDAPLINAGETMPLLYNGELTLYNHGFNANYAVIYKLNIEGFTGSNIYLEYSEYTSPSYIVGSDDGIFVACSVNGKTPNLAYLKRGSTEKFNIPIPYEENIDYVYIVVSGMSSMPLTVRFE